MEVQSTSLVSFGSYQNVLKTLYKRGQMPQVKRGLYGDLLTKDNVSLEHLKPHSEGGKTVLSNLALASKSKNNARGAKPLKDVLNWEMVDEYLSQFNFRIKGFDGNKYAEMIRNTIKELGIINPKEVSKHGKRLRRLNKMG